MAAEVTFDAERSQEASLTLTREGSNTWLLRFGGAWLLAQGESQREKVGRCCEALEPDGKLSLDLSEAEPWDSSLLLAVMKILDACQERNVEIDHDSLPDNVSKLIALARAVPEAEAIPHQKPSLVAQAGAKAVAVWEALRNGLGFFGETTLALGRVIRSPKLIRWRDFFVLLGDCGFRALPIVGMIAFLTGLILAFVGAIQLRAFGADVYVADLVGLAMSREMGALMTSMIMAGRSGAAFAAHLGTMKVSEEIDALTTFGFDPVAMLTLPRLIALVTMMPLLTLYSNLLGYLGGSALGWAMLDISPAQYLYETQTIVTMTDINVGLVKSAVFGFIIAACGCYQGMHCGRDAAAVGQAATRAVVLSITYIVIADSAAAVICEILEI